MEKQANRRERPIELKSRIQDMLRHPLFRNICRFITGYILAGAQLAGGMRPFGLAYALSMSGDALLWACSGCFAGSIMIYGTGGMIYAAACLVAMSAVSFFSDYLEKIPHYAPLCASLCLLIIKAPFAMMEGLPATALLLCECALCLISGFFLSFKQREMTPENARTVIAGRMTLVLCFLMACESFRILGVISPSGIGAILCVMVMTYRFPAGNSAAYGLFFGACMDLAGGAGPFFSAVYGFSSLLAGLPQQRSRVPFTLSYLLSGLACILWGFGSPRGMGCFYEYFIACSIFLLVPEQFLSPIFVPSRQNRAPGADTLSENRIESVSKAIAGLSRSLEPAAPERTANDEDVSTVFDRTAARVCRNCPSASQCWHKDYVTTAGDLTDLLPRLKANNCLLPTDFSRRFSSRCLCLTELCGTINEEYLAHLRRKAHKSRIESSVRLMQEQYDGLAGVLMDIAGRTQSGISSLSATEDTVRAIAKTYAKGVAVQAVSCQGRLSLKISRREEGDILPDMDAFQRSVELALGRRFEAPEQCPAPGNGSAVIFRELESFAVSVGCSVRKKAGEAVSGDVVMHFSTDDGRAIVMLSDGMGTGPNASRLSRGALELIASFVKSGCGIVDSARAVLPVMAARYETSGFATLDLLEINLFSGEAVLLKYGSCDTYVLNDGGVRVISCEALPAGIATPQPSPQPVTLKLDGSERLIMYSDGASLPDASTVRQLMAVPAGGAPPSSSDFMERFAAPSSDDATVIVLEISKK